MKRHTALLPLSREHHHALVLSRQLRQAEDAEQRAAAQDRLTSQWRELIVPHFADEERWILPLLTGEEAGRLQSEHDAMRELAASIVTSTNTPLAQDLHRLGSLLHDHIRWEERELFEAMQDRDDRSALDELLEPLMMIEEQRGPACKT
ncbi:MAG: hemerythrin domain-containing protein [Planctomycetota bacterium]